MIDVKYVLAILFIHFVADFIMQSDWMAQNKSKNWTALSMHVAVYMIGLFGGVGALLAIPEPDEATLLQALAFVGVNGVLHFITDAITSRINSRLWAAKEVHWFFVSVGFDQFIHYTCLFLTFIWLFK